MQSDIMAKYDGGEQYKYPNSDVLINKVNIRIQKDLDNYEADVTAIRLLELFESSPSTAFNLEHLQLIHRHIFQDVYEWAGELRQVDIKKGNSYFGNWALMPNYIKKELAKIEKENYLRGLQPEQFTLRLAHYMSEINSAHPFLEGNGRTQRAFCAQLAEQAGYYVDFGLVEPEEMITIMIASFNGDEIPLAQVLTRITAVIEN
jgi:cell filamentation protein